MTFWSKQVYAREADILYDNVTTSSLNGAVVYPENYTFVGGYKRIPQGVTWGNDGRALKRAKLILPYVAGDSTIHTNLPWVFNVGDQLYEIGDNTENIAAESSAIENNTAQALGTITAINADRSKLTYEVTIATPAVGDVFTLRIGTNFDGRALSFTATTTSVTDVLTGLKNAIADRFESHHDVVEHLDISEDGTKITIKSKQAGEIFNVVPSVSGSTGQIGLAIATGMGEITITPDAGNSNNGLASKVGTITQLPVGIVPHNHFLTDDEGRDMSADVAPYDMANIRKDALPYLDGQIINRLPRIAFKNSPFF